MSVPADLIYEKARSWPAEQKAGMLNYLKSAATRKDIQSRYANAAELAQSIDPDYVITPALQLIADSIEVTLSKPRRNLLVTMPPQEGKSSLCAIWAPIRALQLDPNRRIILATYGDALAETHSLACRDIILTHGTDVVDPVTGARVEDKIGLKLSKKSARVSAWKIDGANGGMVAVGLGSAITGRAADLFIIDDPYKNMMEADSAGHRRKVDEWMSSVALTRLSPEASVILVQCMTGDTPVLRPDGTETPLRDIRVGDQIATYEDGTVTTSTVRNWANQGPDDIHAIIMASGRTVRANARHPFLTVADDGTETWTRLDKLQPGDRIRTASGTDPAPWTGATFKPSAKACAASTTDADTGLTGVDALPLNNTANATYATATASTLPGITHLLKRNVGCARCAEKRQQNATRERIGTGSSASITATTATQCEDCSVTTATSRSATARPPQPSAPPPTTWTVTTDRVVEVVACGREDVFDIQVDRTENFIANGTVSHNTRWHPEDLSGKVIEAERELPRSERSWRHINIPAIAEDGIKDSLGRKPGEVMVSSRGRTIREFENTRRQIGERVWYALYQGSPVNPKGGLFERSWFEPRAENPPTHPVATIVGIDPADSGDNDETGIIGAMLDQDGTVVLAEDWSGQMTSDVWSRQAVILALTLGAREIAMEAYATATTYEAVIKRAWRTLHDEARAKLETGAALSPVETRALSPNMPFTIFKWRAKGDAVGRSALLRQAFETRRARTVEYKLGVFESQAADWQAGQHQPDRVAAALIAHDRLAALGSGQMSMAAPLNERSLAAPEWLKRKVSG